MVLFYFYISTESTCLAHFITLKSSNTRAVYICIAKNLPLLYYDEVYNIQRIDEYFTCEITALIWD